MLIDSNYRVASVSAFGPNILSLTSPSRLVGAHISDLSGERIFKNRAKPRLDACLAGEIQEYYIADFPRMEGRTIRLQMRPVMDPDLGPAVLLAFRDVTGEIDVPPDQIVDADPQPADA